MVDTTPYKLTNFFLKENTAKFFVGLIDVENKNKNMYELCKDTKISYKHLKLILMGMKYYDIIDFRYDVKFKSFVPKYTKKGIKLRSLMSQVIDIMNTSGVWKK